jgi:hypothetical protein
MPSFPLFSHLPKDLRLKIWDEICSVERVLPILPGKGHLKPITQPQLAVPPPLHVCAESRYIALRHYGLRFHPRIYTNPERDTAMIHITSPHQRIDNGLYLGDDGFPKDFNWTVLPRIAVFLDDISFLRVDQDTESTLPSDLYDRTWLNAVTRRERLLPFSAEFLTSLYGIPYDEISGLKGPQEVMLLVLPPLTARPNPVMHRIELIGVPRDSPAEHGLQAMEAFLSEEIDHREEDRTDGWTPPRIKMRYVTCTPWRPQPDPLAGLNEEEKWVEVQPELKRTAPKTDGDDEWRRQQGGEHRTKENAIEEDKRVLFQTLYGDDQGLGPYLIWNRHYPRCGTGMRMTSYSFNGSRDLLWSAELTNEQLQMYRQMPNIKTYKGNGLPRDLQ